MIGLATAFVAALLICAPVAAQRTPAPGDCVALTVDTSGAFPGSGSPGNGQLGFGETVAQTTTPDYEAQRLRTAHRMNQQGIRTAQRGDWIGALQLFETAAQYAPRDPLIQRNLAEARIRAVRQAEELKRQRQQR